MNLFFEKLIYSKEFYEFVRNLAEATLHLTTAKVTDETEKEALG